MNLHAALLQRAAAGTPLRIALIGAGKFGAMYLAQAKHTPGIHIVAVADLAPIRAHAALTRVGWPAERHAARTIADAARNGTTWVTDDALAAIAAGEVEIVVDATGNPAAGIRHVLACCTHGKDVIMVNVEADALAGALLAQRARAAGIVYSLAYGDQPALVCEMVDWCRTAGFEVVAAGKGTRYLPAYHESTPDTVWPHYGFTRETGLELGISVACVGLRREPTGVRLTRGIAAHATVRWTDVTFDAADPAVGLRREMEAAAAAQGSNAAMLGA